MSLSIGIVGLPNVGKSTLFQAITKKQVDRANYPFCTVDPNIGVVAVSDERVEKLAEVLKSAKKIYATVEFVDIAGLIKGAARGEGLGNQFLANIREVDAILYILRCFKNINIVKTKDKIDPLEDKEILETELALKDLEVIEKRINSLFKEAKAGAPEAIAELVVLKKAKEHLNSGKLLIELNWTDEEKNILKNYQFLTLKPRLYLLNGADSEVAKEVLDYFKKNKWQYLIIDILTEFESSELSEKEKEELGIAGESRLSDLIKKTYDLLDLITFFSASEKEIHSWTVRRGALAPEAGAVIHTDFKEKFIRMEAIAWQDLVDSGGYAKAREKGLIRTEGKEYVVKDGDVVVIKI